MVLPKRQRLRIWLLGMALSCSRHLLHRWHDWTALNCTIYAIMQRRVLLPGLQMLQALLIRLLQLLLLLSLTA
jgi:hypothetical protein